MPKRGRPRKTHSLFTVKNFIEYTSDSESDEYNVQHNVRYEVQPGLASFPDQQGDQVNSVVAPYEQGINVEADNDDQFQVDQVEPDNDEQVDQVEPDNEEQFQEDQVEQDNDDQFQEEQVEPDNDDQFQVDQVEQDNDDQFQQQANVDEDADIEGEPNVEEEVESETDEELELNVEDYDSIFEDLKSKWLLTEINHSVSKCASESFWKIAVHYFPKLSSAIGRKKTTQFKTIRRQLHNDLLPNIDLEIVYKNKVSGQLHTVRNSVTPVKNYPSDKFEKLYEIGTIKVCYFSFGIF